MAPGSRSHSWKGEAASALLVTSKLFASRAGSPVESTPSTLLSSFAKLHWARLCHLDGQGWRPGGCLARLCTTPGSWAPTAAVPRPEALCGLLIHSFFQLVPTLSNLPGSPTLTAH